MNNQQHLDYVKKCVSGAKVEDWKASERENKHQQEKCLNPQEQQKFPYPNQKKKET